MYILSYVLLCVVRGFLLYMMYSILRFIGLCVLYTAFDPIIFVQVTRFCLLSYSFMYCILCFLFYLFFMSIFCCVRFVSWSWQDHDYRYNYWCDNVHCHSRARCHIINSYLILHKFCFRFYSRLCSRL